MRPWLDANCEVLSWDKIRAGNLNWTDAHRYWSDVGQTVYGAVAGPAELLYGVATSDAARTQVHRGWDVLWNDPTNSARTVAKATLTPFTDIYNGLVCGESNQLGRGLTGYALILEGARLGRNSGTIPSATSDFLEETGRLGGVLYGEQKLAMLKNYLNRRGVELLVGDEHLPTGKAGGFDGFSPNGPKIVLRSNPTEYEVWHELSHYIQYERIGRKAYQDLPRTHNWHAAEQFVFDMLNRTKRWGKLNEAQQEHAIDYIERIGGFR